MRYFIKITSKEKSPNYEDMNVKCRYCKESFDHTKLTTEVSRNEEGSEYNLYEVCPKCSKPYCCEIEYERP